MINVHTLYEYGIDHRPHGSAYIRLLLPLMHPTNNARLQVTFDRNFAPADVVIVERMWRPDISIEWAENLLEQIRRSRSRLIYAIDDNLLDLDWDGMERKNFLPEQLAVVRLFAREANGIIVSTRALKERFARLNKHIVVVPNALDERLFRTSESGRLSAEGNIRRLVIGYMGTYTHDADIMMVLQAVREILRTYEGRIEFEIIGGVANKAVIDAFHGLPVRVLDTGGHVEYPSFVRWMVEHVNWDLAIAPLVDTPFTRCKSDIKFLDYSAHRIPGIYSRVPAYEQSIGHMETGYLTTNDPDSWVAALDRMLCDDSLRLGLAHNAHAYLHSTRILERRAQDWAEAIHSIAGAG